MIFISLLIVMMLILSVMKRKWPLPANDEIVQLTAWGIARADAYYTESLGSKCETLFSSVDPFG
jgi:hypothetical protein